MQTDHDRQPPADTDTVFSSLRKRHLLLLVALTLVQAAAAAALLIDGPHTPPHNESAATDEALTTAADASDAFTVLAHYATIYVLYVSACLTATSLRVSNAQPAAAPSLLIMVVLLDPIWLVARLIALSTDPEVSCTKDAPDILTVRWVGDDSSFEEALAANSHLYAAPSADGAEAAAPAAADVHIGWYVLRRRHALDLTAAGCLAVETTLLAFGIILACHVLVWSHAHRAMLLSNDSGHLLAQLPAPESAAHAAGSEAAARAVTCAICLAELEPDDEVRPLACRHLLHRACIDRWVAHRGASAACPLCKAPLLITRPAPRAVYSAADADSDEERDASAPQPPAAAYGQAPYVGFLTALV